MIDDGEPEEMGEAAMIAYGVTFAHLLTKACEIVDEDGSTTTLIEEISELACFDAKALVMVGVGALAAFTVKARPAMVALLRTWDAGGDLGAVMAQYADDLREVTPQ